MYKQARRHCRTEAKDQPAQGWATPRCDALRAEPVSGELGPSWEPPWSTESKQSDPGFLYGTGFVLGVGGGFFFSLNTKAVWSAIRGPLRWLAGGRKRPEVAGPCWARVPSGRGGPGASLHGSRGTLVSVPPHLLDLPAPLVSVAARVHQVVRPVGRVDKKGLEVLCLRPELL